MTCALISLIIARVRKSSTTAADNKRFNKVNKFRGPDPQLQINLPTSQPEEIRMKFYNCFIQNHLKSSQWYIKYYLPYKNAKYLSELI